MKKHFLSFILLALTLGWSANAWAEFTIKKGVYYVDLTGITMASNAKVEIFNDYASALELTSSSCNTNVVQNGGTGNKNFYCKSGQSWPDYFVVELTSDTKIDDEGRSFVQIYDNGSNNLGWKRYNEATYTDGNNCVKLTTSGYSWATISAPSCGGDTPPTPSGPCSNCKTITK